MAVTRPHPPIFSLFFFLPLAAARRSGVGAGVRWPVVGRGGMG